MVKKSENLRTLYVEAPKEELCYIHALQFLASFRRRSVPRDNGESGRLLDDNDHDDDDDDGSEIKEFNSMNNGRRKPRIQSMTRV